MARYRTSRVIPITLILIVVAVSIAALFSIGRMIFFPNAAPDAVISRVEMSRESLLNTSLDHSVSMRVRGEIVAAENHRSYDIVVTPNSRTMTIYKGYTGDKLRQIKLSNSVAAYEQFVYALNEVGLVDGRELNDQQNDTRGLCPRGNVYSFDIIDGDQTVADIWTTTCRNIRGSLDGSPTELRSLFLNQIPDGSDIIRKVDL